jgi:Tol biopolymer transport system component
MNDKRPRISATLTFVVSLGLGSAAIAAPSYSEWSPATNLGGAVNSSWDDSGPGLSKDGLSLYFTSTRPGFGKEDIWVSQRASATDPWGAPANLGPTINTTEFERVPNFSRDGHWMFFGSSRLGGLGSFDIWASWRPFVHDDFGWQTPVNLGPGINTAFTENAPAFLATDDGAQFMYFTSNRPGGPGDFDLYVSARQLDGNWGAATPVVELNTSFNESRPALRHDGLEIFFQSNRPGSTVFDLWSATRDSTADAWSAAEHLGVVNSASADIQPTISSDRQTLIFSSGRSGGFGLLDLYVTTRTKLTGKP